jgi:hypothetical protein
VTEQQLRREITGNVSLTCRYYGIGAHRRHTTPEMAARVVAAVEERLVVVLTTAEAGLDQQPW